MAVQAQFGGLAGFLPPFGGAGLAEEQMLALLSGTVGNKAYQYNNCAAGGVVSSAQSELTCNGGGGVIALPSRKRGRDDEFDQFVTSSSSALLPIPGMQQATIANKMVDSAAAAASTSGRPATASAADALLVSELWQQQCAAEVDAVVRAECERLRAGLEQAHKRQRQAVARAAAAGAVALLRAKEAELGAARRRATELEERLRQAAAESQAWCGVARSNEAVAQGLRAALDAILLRGAGAGTLAPPAEEGFGDSCAGDMAAADDAESCCFVEAVDAGAAAANATSAPAAASMWACRACGSGEASVLLLPCRHLCLCKSCEPRAEACPVCLAAKTGAIHVAGN